MEGRMKIARCLIQREQAPPGFWPWRDDSALVDGVEFESAVPTRFFQSVDAYPKDLGRLGWRVQLNRIADGRAGLPMFRTFYPGVEWNLNHSGARWFLTAWYKWERHAGEREDAQSVKPERIEGDTVWFPIVSASPNVGKALYLRSRVDARDRRAIASGIAAHNTSDASSDSALIVLDDLIDIHGSASDSSRH
jgi:hypothetical protein